MMALDNNPTSIRLLENFNTNLALLPLKDKLYKRTRICNYFKENFVTFLVLDTLNRTAKSVRWLQ